MIVQQLAIYAILGLTYLGLALGYIPGVRMNRARIALVGSGFLIGLGALSLQEAWLAIDAKTIVFLLSMMVVNANLFYAGFFVRSLWVLLSLTRSPLGLLITLTFGSGILSAFFLNDTLALIFTPLTLSLTQTLGLNPIPYLLAIAAATNIGSMINSWAWAILAHRVHKSQKPPTFLNQGFSTFKLSVFSVLGVVYYIIKMLLLERWGESGVFYHQQL